MRAGVITHSGLLTAFQLKPERSQVLGQVQAAAASSPDRYHSTLLGY